MNRMKWVVTILCASTAIQAQARDIRAKATPVAISAIDADDLNASSENITDNIDRMDDILQACVVNRGGSAFGRNATPGIVTPVNIRGIKPEYGTRYTSVLQTPDGVPLTVDQLKNVELLPGPNFLSCDGKPVTLTLDDIPSIELVSPGPQNQDDLLTPTQDPELAVQPLPPEVKSGRSLPRAADVRAELDGIVALCRTVSAEDGPALRARYERYFAQLRELRAVRDDLRERLLTNDPTLDKEDALNQLKKLDPAVDGAVFPSQLKCPPAPGEPVSQSSYDPDAAKSYLIAANEEIEPRFPESFYNEEGELVGAGVPESPSPAGPAETSVSYKIFADLSLGQTDFDTSQTGIGFQSTGPGTETFADTVPSRVDSFTASAGLSYKPSGSDLTYTFYGSYGEGDARTDFDIPAGGSIDVGNVYGGLSPSGSTGLNIGNRGLIGFSSSAQKIYEAKVSISKPLNADDDFAVIGALFFNTIIIDRDYASESRASVFGTTITQQRDQEVSDNLYGLGGILNGRVRIADGVNATGAVAGGIYYRDTDLEAQEINDCALCPPVDQNFTLDFDESDSGVTFAGTVSAGLEFDVASNLKFSLGADASYVSDVGQVINPSSGDQVLAGETTRLGLTDAWRWRATAGLKLSFR